MPPSLAKNWGMPNKDRSFHEAPEKAGGEGWLYSEQQRGLSMPLLSPLKAVALFILLATSAIEANKEMPADIFSIYAENKTTIKRSK